MIHVVPIDEHYGSDSDAPHDVSETAEGLVLFASLNSIYIQNYRLSIYIYRYFGAKLNTKSVIYIARTRSGNVHGYPRFLNLGGAAARGKSLRPTATGDIATSCG
jgi:hypothetical protein